MVAALHETLAYKVHIRRSREQLQPCDPVAFGHRNFSQVLPVVAVGMSGSVPGQAEDGIFLSLRPQALAANIGANAREYVRAEDIEEKDADHDGNEHTNDDQHSSGDGKAGENRRPNSHAVRGAKT